jgi:hypothetical protein
MASKDGKMSFDFIGKCTSAEHHKQLFYVLGDGRKAEVYFSKKPSGKVRVDVNVEPESENSEQLQQGWQSILNNYKAYCKAN